MSENKALITTYLRALSGRPKPPELVRAYVADENLAAHIAAVEAAFPEYELVIDDVLGEDDLVAVRGTFRGRHLGPFAGVEPTARLVTAGLIIIYRLKNGQIVEHWLQMDRVALLGQLQQAPAAVAA